MDAARECRLRPAWHFLAGIRAADGLRQLYFLPLSPRDDLRFRADAGWIVSDTSEDIPQHFLFRTRGDTSVRGYEYQSLGVDTGEAIVGGRYLGVGSAEYTRWIAKVGASPVSSTRATRPTT